METISLLNILAVIPINLSKVIYILGLGRRYNTDLSHSVGDIQVAGIAEVESVQETGALLLLLNVCVLGDPRLVQMFLHWQLRLLPREEGEETGGVAHSPAGGEDQENSQSSHSLHPLTAATQLTGSPWVTLRQVTLPHTGRRGSRGTRGHGDSGTPSNILHNY